MKWPWFILRCSYSIWEKSLRKTTSPNNWPAVQEYDSRFSELFGIIFFLFICGSFNDAFAISC